MEQHGQRAYWLSAMRRIVEPVVGSLARRELKARMPVEESAGGRAAYTHLEAIGRTLAGIAPGSNCGKGWGGRGAARFHGRAGCVRPSTPGRIPALPTSSNFERGLQPLVDVAFLAHAIVRAPGELWERLSPRVKRNLAAVLKSTRHGRKPGFNNWLLFSAMIEAALAQMGEADWDRMRVDYALRQHEQWYLGDGVYGDGPRLSLGLLQ